jgi:hypothetical protein
MAFASRCLLSCKTRFLIVFQFSRLRMYKVEINRSSRWTHDTMFQRLLRRPLRRDCVRSLGTYVKLSMSLPQRRGVVIGFSAFGTEDSGFDSRQGVRCLDFMSALQCCCYWGYINGKKTFNQLHAYLLRNTTSSCVVSDGSTVGLFITYVHSKSHFKRPSPVPVMVARWHIFKPNITFWVNFGVSCNGRCW